MKNVIDIICRDPNIRIPYEYRSDKTAAAKFLLSTVQINPNEIKNPGWWAIKRWLDESATSDDYDEVLSIEKIGEESTYDLNVPDGNSFSANGFTVHNCNLPSDATRELVSDVYLNAWKSGCKGFTVYRDGSRTGVLVATDDAGKKNDASKDGRSAAKRPKELACDIHRVNIKGDSWLVLVGLNEGQPYEIFCGLSGNIEVPKKVKSGKIIKNGKKNGVATYNLIVPVNADDQIVFKDISNMFDNPTQSSFTRTLSLTLRHGIPINFVVEQLQKGKENEHDMFTFSRCLARVLKTYIPDGVKATGDKSCPDCKTEGLIYKEGCVSCVNCGYSKCS